MIPFCFIKFHIFSTKSLDSLTLKRHSSFQNWNNRKATHSFAPRPQIFKLQWEVLIYNSMVSAWSSQKTDLKTNFLNFENRRALRTRSTDTRSENAHLALTDRFADCFMVKDIEFESYSGKICVLSRWDKNYSKSWLNQLHCALTIVSLHNSFNNFSCRQKFTVTIRGNFILIYFYFYRDLPKEKYNQYQINLIHIKVCSCELQWKQRKLFVTKYTMYQIRKHSNIKDFVYCWLKLRTHWLITWNWMKTFCHSKQKR